MLYKSELVKMLQEILRDVDNFLQQTTTSGAIAADHQSITKLIRTADRVRGRLDDDANKD